MNMNNGSEIKRLKMTGLNKVNMNKKGDYD